MELEDVEQRIQFINEARFDVTERDLRKLADELSGNECLITT